MLIKLAILLFSASMASAHKAHHHEPQKPASTERLDAVRAAYEQEVRSIFTQKCMDCHSQNTRFPWYYQIPLVRQLIDRDIREAKSHIDMTPGFPFQSHGTPQEDLEAIAEVVKAGSMPPWRYRVMHSGTELTEAEKATVLKWTEIGRIPSP